MRSTSSMLRAGLLAPVVVASVFCSAVPANAATVNMNWNCLAPVVNFQISSMTALVTGTAPISVASGAAVTITITPGGSTVDGPTVNYISNLKMTFPTPANSTLVSVTASGGSVAGTVSTSDGNVVLTIPSLIRRGAYFHPPTVTMNVTAGTAGTPITSKYAGTSYTDPGMTMTSNITILGGTTNVATSCYPNPSPTLTSTTVS